MNRKRRYKIRQKKLRKKLEVMGQCLNNPCPYCGNNLFFYYRFDATCCMECDIWCEEKCSDPTCPYCAARPDTPSLALYYEEAGNDLTKEWLRKNYFHKTAGEKRHILKREKTLHGTK